MPEELRAPLLEVGRAYDLRFGARHPGEEQKAAYVQLADRLGVGEYLRGRFIFAGTPAEVEAQVRAAMRAGATSFDGAIDADLPEHERRITAWAAACCRASAVRPERRPHDRRADHGRHVVTPQQEGRLDVGIAGERIAFVAEPGTVAAEAARTLDASGLLVLPGGVEPHAHIHEPMHRGWSQGREEWLQPPEGATRAALFGGTTTVISFAFMDVHVQDRELDCNLAVQHRTAPQRALLRGLRVPPRAHRHAGRDDARHHRRGRGRRHGDVQVLHDRPDDDPGRRAPQDHRLGPRAAGRVRAARSDGDGTPRTTT